MSGKDPVPQSAVIAYRRRWWRTKIVLVTSMTTQRWVLPKGHVEDGLTPQESAAREAEEEAGVQGVVGPESLGSYDYRKSEAKGGGLRRVDVFPMAVSLVQRDWPEMYRRRRKWMSIAESIEAVIEPELKEILARFGQAMKIG